MKRLFDHESTSELSDTFEVPGTGGGVLLSLYGGDNVCIKFKKILMGNTESSNGSCNKRKGHKKAIIEQSEDITQAGNWVIASDNNTGIMVLPGVYRAEVNQDLVGTFVLTANHISQEAVVNTPDHLRYGWINNPNLEN